MAVNNIDLPETLVPVQDYDLLAFEAHRIVDNVLTQSLVHVRDETGYKSEGKNQRGRYIELENGDWDARRGEQAVVRWPTIEEFKNTNVGVEKINEYIEKQWKTAPGGQDPCWLYVTDFVEKKSLEFHDLYIYRVRYSIPTRRQPIPKQTASIYFTFEVSKVKPKNTPIPVSFVFESMRLVHYPDQFRFRQTWLENILRLKETLTNEMDF